MYKRQPLFDPLLEPTMQRWGRELLDWLHNHPSFVMLTLGNEINGDRSLLERLVEYLRAQDPTRMYAQGSNDFIRQPVSYTHLDVYKRQF